MQEDVLDARVQLGRRAAVLAEPPDVLAQGRAHARRAPALARCLVEHGPRHLAGEPQPVQPLALVVFDPRGQEILLPDAHRKVLALEQLERRQHAGRPGQSMVGMQVVTAEEERGELLGRRDRAGDAARVDLAALDLIEHRDVDVLRRGRLREKRAAAHEAARRESLQRPGGGVSRQAVALGEPRRGHRPSCPQQAQRHALETRVGRERAVQRGVGRARPGLPPARELEDQDPVLRRERGDHPLAVVERASRDLGGGQVSEVVEDSGQLVRVARSSVGRRLL